MTTRAQLRRMIGKRTGQPYFRRFGGSNGTGSATGSTTTLIDTVRLKEEDDYWRADYIYFPTTDEIREISDFVQSTSTVTWLAAATTTISGTVYEIWSQFTPQEVHDALDHALLSAWPAFFLAAVDESLVIEENAGLSYTLPTTNLIKRLLSVGVITYNGSETGTVTTLGTTVQVIDSAANFVAADVGKWIAVYSGGSTANGTVRQITVRDSATQVTVSPAFAVALPTATKYRMLDKTFMYTGQGVSQDWKVDKLDNPTTLYFGSQPTGYEGHLLRLFYEYEYPVLTAEATDTTCPQEYVLAEALAYLYTQKVATAPVTEQPAWVALQQRYSMLAQEFIKTHRQQHLPSTLLRFDQSMGSLPADYPF